MSWYYILIIILAIPLLCLALGYRVARGAYHPFRHSLLETRALENERTPDLMAQYDAWEKHPYVVRSPFGYDLKTYYLPCDDPTAGSNRKFVVIAHGFSYTHHGSIKYAALMKDLGYHVVMYDERFHGESGGDSCTLGYYEQHDLRAVVDDTFARFGPALFLGTYGESMGAVVALLEQADDPRIRFVVADCPFATMRDQITHLIRRVKYIPVWPALPLGAWLFQLRTKAVVDAVRPIDAVQKAHMPILFIHGADDRFVPPAASERLYAACPTTKEFYLAGNGARHAESFRKNRVQYTEVLCRFMQDHVHEH